MWSGYVHVNVNSASCILVKGNRTTIACFGRQQTSGSVVISVVRECRPNTRKTPSTSSNQIYVNKKSLLLPIPSVLATSNQLIQSFKSQEPQENSPKLLNCTSCWARLFIRALLVFFLSPLFLRTSINQRRFGGILIQRGDIGIMKLEALPQCFIFGLRTSYELTNRLGC